MASPFDVCIRGGGITGRTLALLLARERLRVGFVAQEPNQGGTGQVDGATPADVKNDVRAFALNLKSRQLLESVRCWPDEGHATPVLTMRVQGDDGGEVIFNAADHAVPALAWIVDVPVLEAQLAQAMQFQPQIELLDVAQPALLTVVCEGKASLSRAEFGVDFDVAPYSQRAIAARLHCEKPHLQTARQWFSSEGILGVLPMGNSPGRLLGESMDAAKEGPSGNSIAIVWSVEEARAMALLQMGAGDFCRALQVASHDCFGALTLISERAMWPLHLARTDRWVGRAGGMAWALAGDAAHTVHPLSGQGLNLGLADVAKLASLIAKRDYWRSVADEKLLHRYERARKADAAALSLATDGLQRLFAHGSSSWQTLRNVGMNGFERSGPLKHWVARQAMGA